RVLETSQSRFPTRPPRCLPAAVERVPEKSRPGHELIGRSAFDIGDAQAARLVIRLQHVTHTYRVSAGAFAGHRSPCRYAPTAEAPRRGRADALFEPPSRHPPA